jgi:hypothetical protein
VTRAVRPTTTWALALVVSVAALAVQVTSQVGKNGCIRHGADGIAAIGHGVDHATPQLEEARTGEAAHAPCALCAAPAPSSCSTAGTVTAPAVARVAGTDPVTLVPRRAAPEAPPLDYAPKTSPPIA